MSAPARLPTVAALLALTTLAGRVAAHEFRPAILDVTDLGAGRYEVIWSAPTMGGEAADGAPEAAPDFPSDCRREPMAAAPPGAPVRVVVDCGPTGLGGRALTVRGLGAGHVDALVRFTGPGGAVTAVLRADQPAFVVPGPAAPEAPASRLARARGYFRAGVGHILRGPDHLLFLLGLLLLVKGKAALARTITGFTLAHSLTLALAVTGAVRLPPAAVEAVIALSLVVLAGELARHRPGAPPTLARRRPFLLAFTFGLLHGFGFAGGLAELRVPAAEIPLALGMWNLGVEAGQLAFVAAALAGLAVLRRVPHPGSPHLARIPAYALGSLATCWLIERVSIFWSV